MIVSSIFRGSHYFLALAVCTYSGHCITRRVLYWADRKNTLLLNIGLRLREVRRWWKVHFWKSLIWISLIIEVGDLICFQTSTDWHCLRFRCCTKINSAAPHLIGLCVWINSKGVWTLFACRGKLLRLFCAFGGFELIPCCSSLLMHGFWLFSFDRNVNYWAGF